MNIKRRCKVDSWPSATQRDIHRIFEVWHQLRAESVGTGPWLLGTRGIVDAFYAPVFTRFRSYGVELPEDLQDVANILFDDDDFREWEARPITDGFAFIDTLYPAA